MVMNTSGNDFNFKIIFWGSSVSDMNVLQGSIYSQIISKFNPKRILDDKYILKYYWDEQLIEFDNKRIMNDTGKHFIKLEGGLFSVVLNNKFVYHGINELIIMPQKNKFTDSNYPSIISKASINPEILILALKPNNRPLLDIFRDFDKKEQNTILYEEVLKYFEKQGKIIRGKINLDEILRDKYISSHD